MANIIFFKCEVNENKLESGINLSFDFKKISGIPISFSGDKSVKALVQLMSASMAGVLHLDYYSFGDLEFHRKFNSCRQLLQDRKVSIPITSFLNNVRL